MRNAGDEIFDWLGAIVDDNQFAAVIILIRKTLNRLRKKPTAIMRRH
jgi:hypothetical protein